MANCGAQQYHAAPDQCWNIAQNRATAGSRSRFFFPCRQTTAHFPHEPLLISGISDILAACMIECGRSDIRNYGHRLNRAALLESNRYTRPMLGILPSLRSIAEWRGFASIACQPRPPLGLSRNKKISPTTRAESGRIHLWATLAI